MVMMENVSPVEAIRTLGARFKDYRMRLNLTQRQVSELTAISVPTIYY